MKLATSLVTVFVLCVCTAAFANVNSTPDNAFDVDAAMALKDANVSGIPNPQINVGGDDIGSAVNIPALPYNDGGNTCSFNNTYDEVCPFTGSLSPDVVYAYSPGADASLDIAICNSLYDTKLYVYENAAGNLVGCNDDACGSDGFKSELVGLPVTAGNTYYIVVDGYGSDCGEYVLDVTENVPCVVECPPNGVAEGEPVCGTDYNDTFNGGCNSTPNVFSNIPCDGTGGQTVCGEYGGFLFNGLSYRDTDWYQLDTLANINGVVVCVTGQYDTLSGYLFGGAGCGAPAFVESAVMGPCDTACFNVPAGNYWVFVGTANFGPGAGACGGAYVLTVDGYECEPTSVENASWGEIKSLHR